MLHREAEPCDVLSDISFLLPRLAVLNRYICMTPQCLIYKRNLLGGRLPVVGDLSKAT